MIKPTYKMESISLFVVYIIIYKIKALKVLVGTKPENSDIYIKCGFTLETLTRCNTSIFYQEFTMCNPSQTRYI